MVHMNSARALPLIVSGLISLYAGCYTPAMPTPIPTGLSSPYTGYKSPVYSQDPMWLCRPGMAGDACRADLTATEVLPDGSRVVVPHQPATDPKVDCFLYLSDRRFLGLLPANHTDFHDREPMRWTTRYPRSPG